MIPADVKDTPNDRNNGSPLYRAALAATDTALLLNAYGQGMRDCIAFYNGNAVYRQNLIATELLSRDVTALPNFFGPIAIKADWQNWGPRSSAYAKATAQS